MRATHLRVLLCIVLADDGVKNGGVMDAPCPCLLKYGVHFCRIAFPSCRFQESRVAESVLRNPHFFPHLADKDFILSSLQYAPSSQGEEKLLQACCLVLN